MLNKEEVTEIFWFIRVPILLLLYFVSSEKRNIIYFGGLILYQLASVFYRLELPHAFVYATVFSMLFKLCLVLLVLDLIRKSNYKAICIAFIPFFVIYLYIIEFVVHELGDSYYIWIVNALLTSFIGSVAIINYVNEPKHRNYWLLISSVLFIIQIGAFFINKFYIRNDGIYQMVILAYGISHYTFYKFMILKEQEEK